MGECSEDSHMAGHCVKLHGILWLGFTELVVRCALHGFLGQRQHNRFMSPPGWFTQALGLTSDLYKVYQVPGFQRVGGYFGSRVWSHQSQLLKNFPGFCHFCHLAHVCAVSGYVWRAAGLADARNTTVQLNPGSCFLGTVPCIFIYCGEKKF